MSMHDNYNQRQIHDSYKTAERISFQVQNSRSSDDMQLAHDAWKRFLNLTDNETDRKTARFWCRRYKILAQVNTRPWAYMRGVLAGEAMERSFGNSVTHTPPMTEEDLQQASEALAIVPRSQRPYVGETVPPAPTVSIQLAEAYWKGFNHGVKHPEI
jgi:hypothetical protein